METLLANPFEKTFTEFVEKEDIIEIKRCLFEQYCLTFESSIKDFAKFEFVTEQVLGDDGISTIKKTFDQICHMKSKHIVEIKDQSLQNIILSSFKDIAKKHILGIAFDYPLTLWEIASKIKIGTHHVSENISYLISNGLLATSDVDDTEYNKKYYSVIDDVNVNVDDKKFSMFVTINEIASVNLPKVFS